MDRPEASPLFVLAGRRSEELAARVAEELGATLADRECKTFPDGEVFVRIDSDLTDADVIVVQTTLGPGAFEELLFLLDAARERGCDRLVAAVPYYAYSRQDQRFNEGEAFSADVIARTLAIYADALLIIDPHKSTILDSFDGDTGEASAVPELAAYFADHGVDAILAPDKGAIERARMAADLMGVPCDYLEKTRVDAETVVMKAKELDVSGKVVAIVDDIISTGGTMAKAVAQLQEQGAKAVYCAATHGLLIGGAVEKLTKAGVAQIVVTDTLPGEHSRVSAAPAIARGIKALLQLETSVDVTP